VHFIRQLPSLTADEKAQMEALNPKSPDEWRALQDEDAFLRGEAPAAREPGHESTSVPPTFEEHRTRPFQRPGAAYPGTPPGPAEARRRWPP
jgi:hypothetical protein